MVDKLVRKPDDLKGMKMRIPTRTGAWIIEALGAAPVGMPVPDLPQALSKKVVDGAFIPWEIIPALKLQEMIKYEIEGPGKVRFGNTTFQVSMNEARWNSLPADVKKAFTDVSGEAWVRKVGQIWAQNDDGRHRAWRRRRATSTFSSPLPNSTRSGSSSSRWSSAGSPRSRRRGSTARRSWPRRARRSRSTRSNNR